MREWRERERERAKSLFGFGLAETLLTPCCTIHKTIVIHPTSFVLGDIVSAPYNRYVCFWHFLLCTDPQNMNVEVKNKKKKKDSQRKNRSKIHYTHLTFIQSQLHTPYAPNHRSNEISLLSIWEAVQLSPHIHLLWFYSQLLLCLPKSCTYWSSISLSLIHI